MGRKPKGDKPSPKKRALLPLEIKDKHELVGKGTPPKILQFAEEIIKNIRSGLPTKHAVAGMIDITTFQDWYNQGSQERIDGVESHYSLFSYNVDKAKKEYIDKLKSIIEDHAPADWKAASWLLERRDKENYNLTHKVDVTSKGESIAKPLFMPSKDD